MNEEGGIPGIRDGSAVELTLPAGDLDAEAISRLERDLRVLGFRGERRVVVDLSAARELTPALAGALLRAQRRLSWRNGRLVVIATAEMRQVLARMGLDEALDLVDASARDT